MKSRIYSSLILFFLAISLTSCYFIQAPKWMVDAFSNYSPPTLEQIISKVIKSNNNDSLAIRVKIINETIKESNNSIDFSTAKQIDILDTVNNNQYNILICKKTIKSNNKYIEYFKISEQYDYYIYAFLNNNLFFWGTIDDFKRSENELINSLGIDISNYILNKGY